MSTNDIIIKKLVFPETVRQNVGMYLGNTTDFTTPLREIINNSTDELINNHATWVDIVNKPNFKMVIDNGRGMPIYADPEDTTVTIARAAVGSLHAGSKIGDTPEITSGLHGVGASAVNAVSKDFWLIVHLNENNKETLPECLKSNIDGDYYILHYENGYFQEDGFIYYSDLCKKFDYKFRKDSATIVAFIPDTTIYNSGEAKVSILPLQITKANFPKSSITINGENVKPFSFKHEVAKDCELFLDKEIPFEIDHYGVLKITGILAYDNKSMQDSYVSLINLIETTQGGYLENTLYKCFGNALAKYNEIINSSDARLGLIMFSNAFTSYKLSFASQTKEKLVSLGLASDVALVEELRRQGKSQEEIDIECHKHVCYTSYLKSTITDAFYKLIKKNSSFFDALCEKIIEYKKQLNKLSNTDFIRSKVILGDESDRKRSGVTASKVYEATSRDWSIRELYVTEGLSASSSLIMLRNPKYQSILPLRGKVLNSANMDDVDVVNNAELLALINTIGCGMGDVADAEKSRYSKIIIATDVDSDGYHISNLITAVFLYHCPDIIKSGRLYKLTPPYYAVRDKKGNMSYYGFEEKDKIDFEKCHVEKRKGLGSYTKDEVTKFMINPDTRILTQITFDDEDDVKRAASLLYSSSARRNLMIKTGVLGV